MVTLADASLLSCSAAPVVAGLSVCRVDVTAVLVAMVTTRVILAPL